MLQVQEILWIHTKDDHIRSATTYCKAESGNNVRKAQFSYLTLREGYANSGLDKFPGEIHIQYADADRYPTPLHALGDGWHLMGPPVMLQAKQYEWMFTRSVEAR